MQNNYVLYTSFDEGTPTEPVTLDEAKGYLIISLTETAFDTLITQLIITARQQLEGYLNRSLIDKTVTATVVNEVGSMHLPYIGDEITITGVTDNEGDTIDDYEIFDDMFCVNPATTATPANNFYTRCITAAKVTYTVAYPNGIKSEFKTAIMQQVAWLYERGRGDEFTQAISPIVKINMKPYRRIF